MKSEERGRAKEPGARRIGVAERERDQEKQGNPDIGLGNGSK